MLLVAEDNEFASASLLAQELHLAFRSGLVPRGEARAPGSFSGVALFLVLAERLEVDGGEWCSIGEALK